jgi:hypothetical protein
MKGKKNAGARTGPLGAHRWAIPEGYIPGSSTGEGRELESHETACILNTSEQDAQIDLIVYFTDRDPVGPYRLVVRARRTYHLRFNDLKDPAPIPRDTDFASEFRSDVPIVVQHTRLDSRQAELGLLSTMAFASFS